VGYIAEMFLDLSMGKLVSRYMSSLRDRIDEIISSTGARNLQTAHLMSFHLLLGIQVKYKVPALSWLWVIEACKHLGKDLPVNIKLLFEGMEESGSEGMEEAIVELVKPGGFLNDVDFFCISDNYWTGKRKPCFGLRGLAAFMVTVQCCESARQ
jgi:hypothetical protein